MMIVVLLDVAFDLASYTESLTIDYKPQFAINSFVRTDSVEYQPQRRCIVFRFPSLPAGLWEGAAYDPSQNRGEPPRYLKVLISSLNRDSSSREASEAEDADREREGVLQVGCCHSPKEDCRVGLGRVDRARVEDEEGQAGPEARQSQGLAGRHVRCLSR